MSAATATPIRAIFGADLTARTFSGHTVEDGPNGTKIVRGVGIFRAGTFRDSMGEQRTWTKRDLRKMVENFHALRDLNIFPNVPVRKDHSWSIDKVLGYFEDLYVKGDKLVADYTVADPADLQNLISGKYRSVSAEIGQYRTNDEVDYYPVMMGFAYVDIPAVEHLHSAALPVTYFSRNPDSEENPNVNPNDDKGAQRPSTFRINGVDTTDHAAVQAHIAALEARPGPATFRVNGAEIADAAVVQTHIDALEEFRQTSRDAGRKSFVEQLVKDGKIVASVQETFSNLALTMTDEQFTQFKAGYENAPKLPLLQNHGKPANQTSKDPAGDGSVSERAILEEAIRMHRNAGLSDEEIEKTKTYKKLQALIAGEQS